MSTLTIILLCAVLVLITVLIYQMVAKGKAVKLSKKYGNQVISLQEQIRMLKSEIVSLTSSNRDRMIIKDFLTIVEDKARADKKYFVIAGLNQVRIALGVPTSKVPRKARKKK